MKRLIAELQKLVYTERPGENIHSMHLSCIIQELNFFILHKSLNAVTIYFHVICLLKEDKIHHQLLYTLIVSLCSRIILFYLHINKYPPYTNQLTSWH